MAGPNTAEGCVREEMPQDALQRLPGGGIYALVQHSGGRAHRAWRSGRRHTARTSLRLGEQRCGDGFELPHLRADAGKHVLEGSDERSRRNERSSSRSGKRTENGSAQ